MALRALRPCSDCQKLTRERYCERCALAHPTHNWHTKQSSSVYGWQWKKLRDRILLRDRYRCLPCKREGRITRAVEVDHITPKHLGGTDAASNLQSICKRCHQAKTLAEAQKAKRNKARIT